MNRFEQALEKFTSDKVSRWTAQDIWGQETLDTVIFALKLAAKLEQGPSAEIIRELVE